MARTVKGQLAFESSARTELEAMVARLEIDFAGHYRPDAELFWRRLNKGKILQIASNILCPDWAAARAKSKKTLIVSSIARAFGLDDAQSSHVLAIARASALEWAPPGFKAFDAGDAAPDTDSPEAPAAGVDLDGPIPGAVGGCGYESGAILEASLE